jgi:hypothetical protein
VGKATKTSPNLVFQTKKRKNCYALALKGSNFVGELLKISPSFHFFKELKMIF